MFLLLFMGVLCHAQENQKVKTYFMKLQDSPFLHIDLRVDNIDSADYIRTTSIDKNNENLYDVADYFLNKKLKRIGNSLNSNAMPKYVGNVIGYYSDGKKAYEEAYVMGDLLGSSTYYNPNGTVLKKVFYSRDDKNRRVGKMEELNDSLGNSILDKEGNGFYRVIEKKGEIVEGNYLKGYKNGTWTTINTSENETYFEEYQNGEFIKGKAVDANGKATKYVEIEALPTFDGGISAFGSFLSRDLRYPPEARSNNVEGRVFIQFFVEEDGSLTGAKVARGIGRGCDEEALRVMNKSPKWNPGTYRGKPIRVSYTIPIFFKLAHPSTIKRPYSDFGPIK